jgi:hypothetical protein
MAMSAASGSRSNLSTPCQTRRLKTPPAASAPARIDYLRSQFAEITDDPGEIEARSLLAFALAIAHDTITADHGAFSHAEAVNLAAELLTAPPRKSR